MEKIPQQGQVIEIIGSPGVGKSFLVKHLACKFCCPGFFEAEDGIWDPKVLKVLNGEEDTQYRYEWIIGRTKQMITKARKIADAGITSYIDGGYHLVEAWRGGELGKYSQPYLDTWLEENKEFLPDKVLMLGATDEYILDGIRGRGRSTEQTDFILDRALRWKQAALDVVEKYDYAGMFDRTNSDFSKIEDFQKLIDFIDTIPARKKFIIY